MTVSVFIAAADGQEVGAPEEHGVITEQEAAAPQEEMGPKDHWGVPGLDPVVERGAPSYRLGTGDQRREAREGRLRICEGPADHSQGVVGQNGVGVEHA